MRKIVGNDLLKFGGEWTFNYYWMNSDYILIFRRFHWEANELEQFRFPDSLSDEQFKFPSKWQ